MLTDIVSFEYADKLQDTNPLKPYILELREMTQKMKGELQTVYTNNELFLYSMDVAKILFEENPQQMGMFMYKLGFTTELPPETFPDDTDINGLEVIDKIQDTNPLKPYTLEYYEWIQKMKGELQPVYTNNELVTYGLEIVKIVLKDKPQLMDMFMDKFGFTTE